MVIKLTEPYTIGHRTYPAHCVVEVDNGVGAQIIADEAGHEVPESVPRRKCADHYSGCQPNAPVGARTIDTVKEPPQRRKGLPPQE